jgi:RHS repeat-associated protein
MTMPAASASAQRPNSSCHSTGKERDAETGLDCFGARYMSAAQGRFMIPDSSSGGINPLDPQSWNRYSYVQNRPLSFVDGNGKWATPIHGDIVRTALQGYVNPGMLIASLLARF